jgi:hypothetical protein
MQLDQKGRNGGLYKELQECLCMLFLIMKYLISLLAAQVIKFEA